MDCWRKTRVSWENQHQHSSSDASECCFLCRETPQLWFELFSSPPSTGINANKKNKKPYISSGYRSYELKGSSQYFQASEKIIRRSEDEIWYMHLKWGLSCSDCQLLQRKSLLVKLSWRKRRHQPRHEEENRGPPQLIAFHFWVQFPDALKCHVHMSSQLWKNHGNFKQSGLTSDMTCSGCKMCASSTKKKQDLVKLMTAGKSHERRVRDGMSGHFDR